MERSPDRTAYNSIARNISGGRVNVVGLRLPEDEAKAAISEISLLR
jgi:hypothetical protein